MQLEYALVWSNEQKEMRDVLEVQNASAGHRIRVHNLNLPNAPLIGWKFTVGMFFVVGYLDGKPVAVRECQLSRPGERKQVNLFALDVHPDYRNRRIPLRMTRYITSWAIHHGYSRVVVPNAIERMQRLYDHIAREPRMMKVNGKPRRAESMSRHDERVVFRIRRRNSQKKSRPH